MKKILLTRLWNRFVALVSQYLADHKMTQQELATKVGMQRSHLNALINGARPLSAYYLLKFIRARVITVNQIKDDLASDDREVEFWKQAAEAENLKLLGLIAKIREETGTDMEKFLRLHFPKV